MNKIKELINHLRQDCRMALNGSWDKSDSGFEAMLDTIVELESEIDKLELRTDDSYSKIVTPKNLWWGYVHTSGIFQAKRYFTTMDTEEAKDSPFCKVVYGPFEAADRDEALEIVKQSAIKGGYEENF